MSLRVKVVAAYELDELYASTLAHFRSPSDAILAALSRSMRSHIERYHLDHSLLTYAIDRFDAPRVGVPNDEDLRARIIHDFHDSPTGGHIGREKTFAAITRYFFWPHLYKWVRKWVCTCEICQRVKPSPSSQAPLRPLPIATGAWSSVSMDFIFGLPPDANGRNSVLAFVDRFSTIIHLVHVSALVSAEESAARRLPPSRSP